MELDRDGLSRLLYGHAAFQYLAAACELNLLDSLAAEPATKQEIAARLGLAERAADVLMLGCSSVGLTAQRNGRYEIGAAVKELIAAGDWQRFKDIVAFYQHIVYVPETDFPESLRQNRNVGLRRIPGEGRDLYHRLSEHPQLRRVFYDFMSSWSELAKRHLVERLDLSGVSALLDCGGGDGINAIELARANAHLRVTILEIEDTVPIAKEKVAAAGLSDRITVVAGDMFAGAFPTGFDCVLFAHQLVIWTLEENTQLLRKAHEALNDGGKVVIFNSISNDEGDGPFLAAMCSAYFASLPAEGGMIYSWQQYEKCLEDAGFGLVERIECPGWTPHGLIVAAK
jgi:ubiquinone/menaquinone biosynthesis C-methylase UbiE